MAPTKARTRRGSNRVTPGSEADGSRICYANNPSRNAEFCDNVVITSQYTALNFVPKFLFEQFSRFANAYFLIVSILQMIPSISITNGIPYSLAPLAAVLFFDAVVTANEDWRRHKADAHDNAKPCTALRDGKFTQTQWSDVRVGDLVRIRRGEVFPADLVFLSAASDDGQTSDVCYVQTAQLDGETNLKLRSSLSTTASMFVSEDAAANFRGFVECEAPNEFFDKFAGVVQLNGPDSMRPNREPLEADNVLLRGCVLRNVQYIYGLVVYTGRETKVRVKQQIRAGKKASVEAVINVNILLLMVMLLSCCAIGTISWAVWSSTAIDAASYLVLDTVSFVGFIEKIFTFFLLNAAFIPVSLYVSMKMARTAQTFLMQRDREMYHEEPELIKATNGREGHFPMQVRTMDLNDELGRISYVFSDKTGTFTLNYMQFRKLLVNGVTYGMGTTQIGRDRMRRLGLLKADSDDEGEVDEVVCRTPGTTSALDKNGRRVVPHVSFVDGSESHPGRTLLAELEGTAAVDAVHAQQLHHFMLHMVLNHTVIPEAVRNEDGEIIGRQLSASSPDEEAFVYAGEYFGYRFVDRRGSCIELEFGGETKTFEVLYILAYNQHRKRMSVIVEDAEGKLWLYMKGADNVLYERLRNSKSDAEEKAQHDTQEHLSNWGNDGLRTLVFGYKEIERSAFDEWSVMYEAARSDLSEMTKRKNKQPNRIDELMEQMETELVLQGATANEDRLQPKVPETIALFARAGIKIWMLTGDKQETAINIGFATKLITDEMEQLIFTSAEMSVDDVASELARKSVELQRLEEKNQMPSPAWALVIDEKALDHVLKVAPDSLLSVSKACKAVICCRARPDQKAKMVAMIKAGVPGTFTLAVGDGANDVDMIKEAHVGVGIAGAEGVQAANASDYSIGRFKFLQRLVLVHGRWNYRRMSKLVAYMFYKNICLVLTQFWYSAWTGWSGQKFYIELMGQSFNLAYTGLPILHLAVFDRDVSADLCLRFPLVYSDGPRGRRLNTRVFWSWVLSAVMESIIVFAVCCIAYDSPNDGESPYVFELGLVCFAAVVLVTSIRVALEQHWHHWTFQVLLFLSAFSLIPSVLVFGSVMDGDGMKGGVTRVFSSPTFWFIMPVLGFMCCIRVAVLKIWRRYFKTELRHVVTEAQTQTRRYSALDVWTKHAFEAELQGHSYTPGLVKKDESMSGRHEAWGAAAESKAEPGTDDKSMRGAKSAPAMSRQHAQKVKDSARIVWAKIRAANRISFRHKYSGCTYSEDTKSTETLATRFAAGRRLRSHQTAPAELWTSAESKPMAPSPKGPGKTAGAGAGAGAGSVPGPGAARPQRAMSADMM